MFSKKKFEIILVVLFLIFSTWLMWKSFSYDPKTHEFVIARNEVGDFGLHLALIRSFSKGNNFPPQSPFYPGPTLPYHYDFDLFAGLLERAGVRIDYAVNGISIIFFVLLLYLIYKMPEALFKAKPNAGMLAVIFFILSSNLSFLDFFRGKILKGELVKQFWRLPDYLDKGPFDGSIISVFSSLNPYLNQRHLIVGMSLAVLVILFITAKLMKNEKISVSMMVIIGILLGLSTRIHLLLTFGTGMVICCLFILYKKIHLIIPFSAFVLLFALPHIKQVLMLDGSLNKTFFNPGFFAPRPHTLVSFLNFWWLNEGLALVLIPLGIWWSGHKQRKFFLAIAPLFIIPNIFQLSFRLEHNYSLIELFFVLSLPFLVTSLSMLWRKSAVWRVVVVTGIFVLTLSGFLNLMVVKNDFHYRVADYGSNPFMQWIKLTEPSAIFLSPQNLYDPVTLAGRKSYFGATFYLQVMGYDIKKRGALTKEFFEVHNVQVFQKMKQLGISYVVLPINPSSDFSYSYRLDRDIFNNNLQKVYFDQNVVVYKL